MSFAKLIGNERNKEILRRLLRSGRLSATLIFAGPESVGKRQFALAYAKAANCRNAATTEVDACDACPVCRRIDAGIYGDVTTIRPDGQFIKIAQTRALAEEVYSRPREGRHRFFLIDDADRLRDEAANSLLKTIEEPPPTSTIILITARPDSLLPTIRSRAQRLNFAPLAAAEMESFIAANHPQPAADIVLLARLTGGRIGRVAAFDLPVYRQERSALLALLDLLAAGDNLHRLLKAAEFLAKHERDEFERKLELLSVLLRDMLLIAAGRTRNEVVNVDVAEKLEELARRVGLTRVIGWTEKIDELRAGLRININRQVATEAALLSLIQPAN